jgi:hypothetical protein
MTIGMNGVADVGAVVVLERTAREQIPRIFHGLTCVIADSFRAIAAHWKSETSIISAFSTLEKVAASSWGRAGRARSGLGRGGVGM